MKRIFLTGSNGFLGSHIARKLVDEGHHVVGLVRKNGASLPPLIPKSHLIEYCEGDIRDPESYVLALRKCTIVIHCAALTAYGVKRTQDYYDINVEGTKSLLEKSVDCGIERFIHTSSRAVFGVAENPELSDEGCGYESIEKEDDYTKSKYLAELEVKKISKKKPMHCIIMAPTALVGAGDSKPSHTGKIVLGLLKGKVQCFMDGGINLIAVEEAASAFTHALDRGEQGKTYLIGNENITLREMFLYIAEAAGVPAPRIRVPYAIAFAGSAVMLLGTKIFGLPPFATPHKVYSLYNNRTYCNPKKGAETFSLKQEPIKYALARAVSWYKDNYYI